VSEAEHPSRLQGDRRVTIDDVRQLMGASTPHFALQLRNRIEKLIRHLPLDDAARIEGEREIARLDRLALAGEERGGPPQDGELPMPSLAEDPDEMTPGLQKGATSADRGS